MSESRPKKRKDIHSIFTPSCTATECSNIAAPTSTSAATLVPNSFKATLQNGVTATALLTATQEILTDLLESRCHEDILYCLNQLARAGILCGFFNAAYPGYTGYDGYIRLAAAPFFQHYYYQFFRDDRLEWYEPDMTAETIAAVLSTATLLGFDVATQVSTGDATFLQASLAGIGMIATNIVTGSATYSAYQWIKRGLFGSSGGAHTETIESKNRSWISLGY